MQFMNLTVSTAPFTTGVERESYGCTGHDLSFPPQYADVNKKKPHVKKPRVANALESNGTNLSGPRKIKICRNRLDINNGPSMILPTPSFANPGPSRSIHTVNEIPLISRSTTGMNVGQEGQGSPVRNITAKAAIAKAMHVEYIAIAANGSE